MRQTDLALGLDRWVCGAFVLICRFFRRLVFRFELRSQDGVREVVVSKYTGLGSILLSQKLLRALRHAYPRARVTYLTFDRSAEILAFLKDAVDEVVMIETSSLWKFIRSSFEAVLLFRRRQVDVYLDIEFFSRYSALMCFFSRPRMSAGYSSSLLSSRRLLYSHGVNYDAGAHVIENFANALRCLGAQVSDEKGYPEIQVTGADLDSARKTMADLGVASPFLVFNASASDALGGYRLWTVSEWIQLTRMTLIKQKTSIVFTGLSTDREMIATIIDGLSASERAHVFDSAGRFGLRQYLAMLSLSRMVVSVDSGTPHFSMALGRPTVILFGPESPSHYGYDHTRCRSVYKFVSCSPCYDITRGKKIVCLNEHRCLTTMTAEEVAGACIDIILDSC